MKALMTKAVREEATGAAFVIAGALHVVDEFPVERLNSLASKTCVAMLLTKPQEKLEPTDHASLARLLQQCPEITELQELRSASHKHPSCSL
jgi:hypothetical protein